MLEIKDLDFGFNDAENYKRSENKSFLNKVFFRTEELDKLCERNTFFLIGEKGTGKTAYATYLSNNDYKETLSTLNYIRETDYQKFVQMKNKEHLVLSDYIDIWKVIIYLLLSTILRTKFEQVLRLKPSSCREQDLFSQVRGRATVRTILNRQRWNAGFSIVTEANTNGGMRVSASASKNVRSIGRANFDKIARPLNYKL